MGDLRPFGIVCRPLRFYVLSPTSSSLGQRVLSFKQTKGVVLEMLIPEDRLRSRIEALAREVSEGEGLGALTLVGVLKGSIHFLSAFALALQRVHPDEVSLEFMWASSYGEGKVSSGEVRIVQDLRDSLGGRRVLIVEDIVDSGGTLRALRARLESLSPRSLKVVSMLVKPDAVREDVPIEYRGFDIPNDFVVGYGLDYGERFRNLPYIATLHESVPLP